MPVKVHKASDYLNTPEDIAGCGVKLRFTAQCPRAAGGAAFDTQPVPAYHVCSGRATRGAGGALNPQPATAGWNSCLRRGARANVPGNGVDGRVPRGAGS